MRIFLTSLLALALGTGSAVFARSDHSENRSSSHHSRSSVNRNRSKSHRTGTNRSTSQTRSNIPSN
ncbi:MAG TPA: hypothetical protein VMB25_14700 [Bryobacteraceae bacterium]|nr:hypothetical protein [Bryobacteraceae bacterium]